MQVRDIMTADVLTVRPDTEVAEAARILLTHGVSGVPVVDARGRVVGIVSEGDLMRRTECEPPRSWWLWLLADETRAFTRSHGTRVRDVMTSQVVPIGKTATLAEAARTLEMHGVKRLPVMDDDRLVGVVSRSDILRGLAAIDTGRATDATPQDQDIRWRIQGLVKDTCSASSPSVGVIVVNGVVYLWGIAQNEKERDAIRVAAESVAGVGNVHDFLNTLGDVVRGAA